MPTVQYILCVLFILQCSVFLAFESFGYNCIETKLKSQENDFQEKLSQNENIV